MAPAVGDATRGFPYFREGELPYRGHTPKSAFAESQARYQTEKDS